MRKPVPVLLGQVVCLMHVPARAQSITGSHRNCQGHAGWRTTRGKRASCVPVAHRWIASDDHQRKRPVPLSRASSGRLHARYPGARIHHTGRQGHPDRRRGDDQRTVILSLEGIQQSVSVEAYGSRIEARESGLEARFGPDDLQGIPVRRFSMFDFIRAAPGVSATSPGSVTTNSVSVFGSGTNENAFLIDGTNFTCPCSGEARSEPGVDFIQEVQIQSIGASAEFGNIQGAVINVITRQGSDRFLYHASITGRLPA